MFGHADFDPNEYANAILAGEPYPPQPGKSKPARTSSLTPANEDISVAISKLNFNIDDVEKQLKNVVRFTLSTFRLISSKVQAGHPAPRGITGTGGRGHRTRRLIGVG